MLKLLLEIGIITAGFTSLGIMYFKYKNAIKDRNNYMYGYYNFEPLIKYNLDVLQKKYKIPSISYSGYGIQYYECKISIVLDKSYKNHLSYFYRKNGQYLITTDNKKPNYNHDKTLEIIKELDKLFGNLR